MRKIIALLLCVALCLALCLAFTGCGDKDEPVEEVSISLFYANSSYIETGDESEGMLHNHFTTYVPEEPGAVPTPLEVVEMLRTIPEKLEGVETAVNDKYKINSVVVADGTATVDVASDGLTGGSLEETLFVRQIVETLIASFDDVQQVKFTVDCEAADTLMGHLDVSEPFTAEYAVEKESGQ